MQTHVVFTSTATGADQTSSTFTPGVGTPSDIFVTASVATLADAAPTDAPVGTFVLQVQHAGAWYDFVDTYGNLAAVSPAGNIVVKKQAVLRGLPALPMRLVYRRTSGGGGDSRLNVTVLTF